MIRKRTGKEGTRFYVYVPGSDGDRRYVGAFGSQKEAKAAEQEHAVTQRKIASGELPAEIDLGRSLRSAVEDDWLKALEQRGSRARGQYKIRMKLYILPKLGSTPIARLTKGQVMRWRDELATKQAPATVNGALTCLSSALSDFVDRGWIPTNPCHGVQQIERPDRVYTWIQTRAEITKLLVECPQGIREIASLALGTGMRLDELLHLQWVDIDLERRLITVHRGRQGTVKSGKARFIPILDAMLTFLRELALKRDGAELVFPGEKVKDKVKPRTKPGVWFPFKQAVARAGFAKSLRFHDLRHTFASHWVLDGGDIFRLSKILGHANVTITQKVYAHLAPDAWEQDYHRVSFDLPSQDDAYGRTKRKPAKRENVAHERAVLRVV